MIPLLALLLSFTVAVTASAATPLAPVALTNAPYTQTPLDVASNGTDFVAIWSDQRSTLDLFNGTAAPALYASRLNADGTAATPAGLRLAPLVYGAKLARNGAGYLVAWNDGQALSTMPLDAAGAPAGAVSVVAHGQPLAAAGNGSNVLLVYIDIAGLHAAILAPSGVVTQTATIADGVVQPSSIWVLPNGSYQFVVAQTKCATEISTTICTSSAVLVTVSDSGAVTEQTLVGVAPGSQLAAAYGNGHVLVATQTTTNPGFIEYRIFDGAVQSHATVQFDAVSNCGCPNSAVSAGWDGNEFLIGWRWEADLRAARVTADGVLLDAAAPIVLDPAGLTAPLFASNGSTTAVVWSSGAPVASDVVARSVRSFDDLAAAPTHVVSQSAALERGVQLASGPNGPLAVWREGYPNPAIAGGIAGGAVATIAPANAFDLQTPAAARGRDAFLVVWREQQVDPFDQDKSFRIMGRRVSLLGVPIDAAPFLIAASTLPIFTSAKPTIAVASDGTDWLVVFADAPLSLHGVRVSADGAVLDATPILLSLGPPHFAIPGSPHVVWSGSRYVVIWTEDPRDPRIITPLPPSSQLYETRVSAAGAVIDTKQIWNGGFVPDLALAAAPDRLLLAWIENSFAVDDMVLGADGTPLTGARAMPHEPIADIGAAWDGSSFVTAWTSRQRSFFQPNVVYQHMDANGVPIEPVPLDVAPELATTYTPSLAQSADGVTVAFEAIADTDVSRAFAATIVRIGPPPRHRAAR